MKLTKHKIPYNIDPGAPMPEIFSNESTVKIMMCLLDSDEKKGIQFDEMLQFKFGHPNVDIIYHNGKYKLGIEPFELIEIEESQWIKDLIKENSIHPNHSDEIFNKYKHYLLVLHDSTLEVISEKFCFI